MFMNIISEVLLSFLDIAVITVDVFDPYKIYGKSTKSYLDWRKTCHLSQKNTSRLLSEGYIVEKKSKYVITDKARNSIGKLIEESFAQSKENQWDELWRIIIFDIPESDRSARNLFRAKLLGLGCEMVQKSVFCHPHDCVREVLFFAKLYRVEKYITIMEVSSIITDKNIFKIFEKKGFI